MYTANTPNAGKLINSLRSTGYSNIAAICDIIDNSLDAGATEILVALIPEKDSKDIQSIIIGDNGQGMDEHVLDEALKLGSDTQKDPDEHLGMYGMGLITASLSLGKYLRVMSKEEDGPVYESIQDVDVVIEENKFVKTTQKLNERDSHDFHQVMPSKKSGTVVEISKLDRITNKNIDSFKKQLLKNIGETYRYFIKSGKKIYINGEAVVVVDPMLVSEGSKLLFESRIKLEWGAMMSVKFKEDVHIRMYLLPDFSAQENAVRGINQGSQGFYVLRNNRQISAGDSLGILTRHNDFNRLRIELFFPAILDNVMGVSFTKQGIRLTQEVRDKISAEILPHVRQVKKMITDARAVTEEKRVDHDFAEEHIRSKLPLLLMPDAVGIKRKSTPRTTPKGKVVKKKPTGEEKHALTRVKNIRGNGVEFRHGSLGDRGNLFECYPEGKKIVVEYNIDHPFFKNILLEHSDNKNFIAGVDYLIFALASAELRSTDETTYTLMGNMRSVLSINLRNLFL